MHDHSWPEGWHSLIHFEVYTYLLGGRGTGIGHAKGHWSPRTKDKGPHLLTETQPRARGEAAIAHSLEEVK